MVIWIVGCGHCMLWMVGVHATLPVLGGDETYVLVQREDLSFLVEMHDVRVLGVSSGGPQRGVLSTLVALVVAIPPPFPPPVTAVMSHRLPGRLFQCFLLGVDVSVNARGF